MAVISSSNPNFDFSARLLDKITAEAKEWDVFGTSPLTSPCSSRPSSPCSSRCPSPSSPLNVPCSLAPTPLDTHPELPPPPFPIPCSPVILDASSFPTKRDRKGKHKATKRKARRKRRAEAAKASFGVYRVRQRVLERYVEDSDIIPSSFATEEARVDSKGFVAISDRRRSKKQYHLEDLVGEGSCMNFKLIEWDGRTPASITDASNRVIGVLAGIPDDEDDWPTMCKEAAKAMEDRRKRCLDPKGKKKGKHRRGAFIALQCGVSHGGGQKKPQNLCNLPQNQTVLDELNDLRPFKRIAGFASAVMASHAPRLYNHYADTLGKLFQHDSRLKKNFPSTIFTGASYNFGPQTVCYPHIDPGNFACGWCAVTPWGDFDYTKGGHLVLWECHLVIQFPPGSTILLPSAIVTHSNTVIAPHEKRHSFALYSSGALFRWVENKFQRSVDYYSSLSAEEEASVEESNKARWKFCLSLLPVVEKKENTVEEK